MTLDQLRYFIAAAKYEHLGRAALSIPISTSVVSLAIKQLEEELGCELFIREKKRVRLNTQGARLFTLASEVLTKSENIRKELTQKDTPLSGHYRIGASHFLAAKLLTPAWTSLQNRFPLLSVDVYSQATWVLIDSVLNGRIDLGIGFSPHPHPQLEMEEIFHGRSLVVARKGHPIFEHDAKHAYKRLGDYPATMHMNTEKILSARQSPVFKNANLDRKVAFGFDSDFVAIENIKASDHWAMMIDLIAAEFKGVLREVPTPNSAHAGYSIQIIRHKSRKPDAAMTEMIALLKERVVKMKRWE